MFLKQHRGNPFRNAIVVSILSYPSAILDAENSSLMGYGPGFRPPQADSVKCLDMHSGVTPGIVHTCIYVGDLLLAQGRTWATFCSLTVVPGRPSARSRS